MALSELVHAWELLKKGAWGGILVGLVFGLWLQDFPFMSVLYSLRYGQGSLTMHPTSITYWVTDLSRPPFELQKHELNMVTLTLWIVAWCFFALLVFGKVGQHRHKAAQKRKN